MNEWIHTDANSDQDRSNIDIKPNANIEVDTAIDTKLKVNYTFFLPQLIDRKYCNFFLVWMLLMYTVYNNNNINNNNKYIPISQHVINHAPVNTF